MIQNYTILDENNQQYPLFAHFGNETVRFFDSNNKQVAVWIEDFPACYLKEIGTILSSLVLENNNSSSALLKGNRSSDIFHLIVEDWTKIDTTRIEWVKKGASDGDGFNAPNCLKIFGLKKAIAKKMRFKLCEFRFCSQGYKLCDDDMTIAEYGLREKCIELELIHGGGGGSFLEWGMGVTIRNKESIESFRLLKDQLDKKIDIVCKIRFHLKSEERFREGTGFLIGNGFIMTNYHVIKLAHEKKTEMEAIFFFNKEGEDQNKITIKVDPSPLCSSAAPKEIEEVNAITPLDYAILRLKPDKNQEKKLSKISEIGKELFSSAVKKWKNSKKEKIVEDISHVNIIQHPSDPKVTIPKKIVFRNNRAIIANPHVLHYEAQTGPGSSGSPVLNDRGELIGLHYSACKKIDKFFYDHHEKILNLRGFHKDENVNTMPSEKLEMTRFEKGNDWVLVFHEENEGKGKCSTNKFEEEVHISDFVWHLLEINKPKRVTVEECFKQFISEFIEGLDEYKGRDDWKNDNIPIYKKHIHCNSAVRIDRILDDLNSKRQENSLWECLFKEEEPKKWFDFRIVEKLFNFRIVDLIKNNKELLSVIFITMALTYLVESRRSKLAK